VANPFEQAKRVDLEIRGLRQGWKARVDHKWVMLRPKGLKRVHVTVIPPAGADPCEKLKLDVYGLMQIDDFIQAYGGFNPIIHLANPIQFPEFTVHPLDQPKPPPGTWRFRVSGLTKPALSKVEIAVILTDIRGKHRIVFLQTNASGAFQGDLTVDVKGPWTAQAYYAGDDCNAPTESPAFQFTAGDND
jgi:hypothetical protein